MKTKVTITIDEELVPVAKRYARSKGVSLSRLIENSLREVSTPTKKSFSQRWRGKFHAADRQDRRYRQLKDKYL